jgi:chemotaxis signal transduction protein
VATDAIYKAMLDARAVLDAAVDAPQGGVGRDRCIAFRVGEELYAVSLSDVREVILPPEIVPVPGAGRDVLGVINLRGNVVTVINSRAAFGLGGCPDGAGARILVVDRGSTCVGALVDAVEDIVLIHPDELDPVSATSGPGSSAPGSSAPGSSGPTAKGSASTGPRAQLRGSVLIGDQIAFVVHGAALSGVEALERV